MKPRVLTTLLICSSILTTTVTPAVAAVTNSNESSATMVKSAAATKAKADTPTTTNAVSDSAFVDLQVKNGQLTDLKGQTNWVKKGNPTTTTDPELPGEVHNFDGKSGFYTVFSSAQFDKLKNGMAIEAYFKYDPAADTAHEHEIFSSQESGGLGLGVQNGKVTFFANDGHSYKEPSGDLRVGHWVHAVGVIDKNKTASLYLDGKLVQSLPMPGNLRLAQGTNDFVLGGDAHPGTHVQSQMTGKVKSARLYDHTLTAEQVAALNKEASAETHEVFLGNQAVETMMTGAKAVAIGHTYGLKVHARQVKAGEPGETAIDVVFDPTMLQFDNAERTLGGSKTVVKHVADGRLQITSTAALTTDAFIKYAKTRLAHVNFTAKKAGTTK